MNYPEADTVYNQVKYWVSKNEKPTASSIIILVTLLIKCVENTIGDRSGAYKKQVVMKVIEKVIDNSKLDDDAKIELQMMVVTTIPSIIDTMIGVANGGVGLGKVKGVVKKYWVCF